MRCVCLLGLGGLLRPVGQVSTCSTVCSTPMAASGANAYLTGPQNIPRQDGSAHSWSHSHCCHSHPAGYRSDHLYNSRAVSSGPQRSALSTWVSLVTARHTIPLTTHNTTPSGEVICAYFATIFLLSFPDRGQHFRNKGKPPHWSGTALAITSTLQGIFASFIDSKWNVKFL